MHPYPKNFFIYEDQLKPDGAPLLFKNPATLIYQCRYLFRPCFAGF